MTNMEYSAMNRILVSVVSAAFALMTQIALGQPSSGTDMLASPPELVVVEKVDTELGRLVIEGQEYELYEGDTSLLGIPPEATQRGISLDQVSAGTEVMVITDGTETTSDHRAKIIAMWRPF